MGRELKRVPLDFNWPINTTWRGYLNDLENPSKECGYCKGTGSTTFARRLQDRWYGKTELGMPPFTPEMNGSIPLTVDTPAVRAFATRNVTSSPDFYGHGEAAILREALRLATMWNTQWCHHLNADDVAALVKDGRLYDFTHTWTKGKGWQPKNPPIIPTPEEVNEWSLSGMGHDSINQYICVKAACERAREFPTCAQCDGEGTRWPSPEAKAKYESWERTEPPKGDGYQIWETVSEGSPISPVFATARELAVHMATTKWGTDDGTPAETWLKFIEGPGWAPSMVMQNGVMQSGVEAVVR